MSNINYQILLIEHDKISLYLTEKCLSTTFPHKEVIQKSTCEAALEFLQQNSPSHIIASYRMPDMDGNEFIQEFKKKGFKCGSISFLSDGIIKEKQELAKMNVMVLSKPITPEKIVSIFKTNNEKPFERKQK